MRELTMDELDTQLAEQLPARELMCCSSSCYHSCQPSCGSSCCGGSYNQTGLVNLQNNGIIEVGL